MGNLFNMDNKFFVFMSRVADLAILNFLCIVCCIPIVTAGASITAMFYVTLKMVRNEDAYIVKGFFKSFKENFKQATIIHLIMLVVAALLFLDMRISGQMEGNLYRVLTVVFFALAVVYLFIFMYIYPLVAKFYNTIKNTFVNALLMSIRHLPYTILMIIVTLCPFAVYLIPSAEVQAFILLLLIVLGFSTVAYCNSFFLRKVFDNYIPEEETADADAIPQALLDEQEASSIAADADNALEEHSSLTPTDEETPNSGGEQ
ncbi:MAG: DUF624 domain-containing protein [Eubacteriales bacterium]|nr:DUF624 domain-containing protein [Eubacteriales bacterium]